MRCHCVVGNHDWRQHSDLGMGHEYRLSWELGCGGLSVVSRRSTEATLLDVLAGDINELVFSVEGRAHFGPAVRLGLTDAKCILTAHQRLLEFSVLIMLKSATHRLRRVDVWESKCRGCKAGSNEGRPHDGE
jgi:hypothetical protein